MQIFGISICCVVMSFLSQYIRLVKENLPRGGDFPRTPTNVALAIGSQTTALWLAGKLLRKKIGQIKKLGGKIHIAQFNPGGNG